jgi:hypothetical protein
VAVAAPDSNPIALLLFDIVLQFAEAQSERMFSSELVQRLAGFPGRPWGTLLRGKAIDERWLARQLHPYGIRSRNLRINGQQGRCYELEELRELCLRYVSKAELRAMLDELRPAPPAEAPPPPASSGAPPAPEPGASGPAAGEVKSE